MLRLNGVKVAEFVPEIADNLTTDDSTKALSAKQGKVLNEKITGLIKAEIMTVTTNANGGVSLTYLPPNKFLFAYVDTMQYFQYFVKARKGSSGETAIFIVSDQNVPLANTQVDIGIIHL